MSANKKTSHPLFLVLDQAEKEQQKTSEQVKKAIDFIANEKEQEEKLREYQMEYIKKIQGQQQCVVSEINRYRSFCQQLAQALIQQQSKIAIAEGQLAQLRQQSLAQQHKISILSGLIEEKQNESRSIEEKLVQKAMDELSARKTLPSLNSR